MTGSFPRRRKTLVLALLACVALVPAVYALTPDSPPTAGSSNGPGAASSAPRPLLWKVSDQDNSLYLLGSFHLLKPGDYPLSGDVEAAFADAEKLVFEVSPADLTDPATARKMQSAASYGDDRKLSTVLPQDVHGRLSTLLGAQGMTQLDGFEPWFVSLSLLLGVSQGMGFQANQGLDQHLMQRAATANKPATGLETIDEQLQALDATPMAEQIAGLQDFVDHPAEVPKKLQEMHTAWREADIGKLNALAIDEMRSRTPETYRLINVKRNDAWVPQLRRMLDGPAQDDVLVVVGAMHLLGRDGIVEKLRAKGYKVERICSACSAGK